MSLFVCQECKTVENTALSGFWMRAADSPALCSQCDPAIGEWHGIFPRRVYDGTQTVQWKDGAWIDGVRS